jgi:chromosomal replication initiation ATPase DnaA
MEIIMAAHDPMYIEDRLLFLERRVAALENSAPPDQSRSDNPTCCLEVIVATVSRHLSVPPSLIRSRNRQASVAWARQLCEIFGIEFLPLNQKAVADMFGMHKSSINHSLKTVANRCETCEADRVSVSKMRHDIRANLNIPPLP